MKENDTPISMKISQRIAVFIIIQLLLSIYLPPVPYGNRSIYLVDFWCLLWVAFSLAQNNFDLMKRHWKVLLVGFAVLGVNYFHGMFRISLLQPLGIAIRGNTTGVQYGGLDYSDAFDVIREFIHFIRIFSWFVAFVLAYHVKLSEINEHGNHNLRKVPYFILVTVFGVMALQKFSPVFEQAFAKLYAIDLSYWDWSWRKSSFFRSPNEAAIVMFFCSLLILHSNRARMQVTAVAILLIFTTILTHSATPLFSFALALIASKLIDKKSRIYNIGAAVIFVLCLIIFFIIDSRYMSVHIKLLNFLTRYRTWEVYLKGSLERIDLLFFGFGFTSNHVDNFYIWLFNRGGLLLLVGFIYGLKKASRHAPRSVFYFLLLCGLTLDVFIYRPVIALMLVTLILYRDESRHQVR